MAEYDSWRGDLPGAQIREPVGSVYHYTDAAGLLGILETNQLWATEASGMNDVAETKQGWDFINDWIARQDHSDVAIREMADAFEGNEQGPTGVFVLSASTREDDANQWRLYGNQARGYAVELDPTADLGVGVGLAAQERLEPEPETLGFDTPDGRGGVSLVFAEMLRKVPITKWLHVLYDEEEKSEALETLADAARRTRPLTNPDDGELDEWRGGLIQSLDVLAKLMKGPGFAGENEVRRIVTEWPDSAWSVAHYKASRYGVVRYAKLVADSRGSRLWKRLLTKNEVEQAGQLPIRSVTVGSLIRPENAKPTIEALLRTHGYHDVPVKESAVPIAW